MEGNETDFVDTVFCGWLVEGELEKLNSGGTVIKICILRLSLVKSILWGNYFTSVLNYDTQGEANEASKLEVESWLKYLIK